MQPDFSLAGVTFPFFSDTFRLFMPKFRASLSPPLRAKKRLTAMIEIFSVRTARRMNVRKAMRISPCCCRPMHRKRPGLLP